VSPKKLTAKRARAAVPEWSEKIANFRDSLKLSQSELGKRLGASAMAVSRWERGIQAGSRQHLRPAWEFGW